MSDEENEEEQNEEELENQSNSQPGELTCFCCFESITAYATCNHGFVCRSCFSKLPIDQPCKACNSAFILANPHPHKTIILVKHVKPVKRRATLKSIVEKTSRVCRMFIGPFFLFVVLFALTIPFAISGFTYSTDRVVQCINNRTPTNSSFNYKNCDFGATIGISICAVVYAVEYCLIFLLIVFWFVFHCDCDGYEHDRDGRVKNLQRHAITIMLPLFVWTILHWVAAAIGSLIMSLWTRTFTFTVISFMMGFVVLHGIIVVVAIIGGVCGFSGVVTVTSVMKFCRGK